MELARVASFAVQSYGIGVGNITEDTLRVKKAAVPKFTTFSETAGVSTTTS